MYEPHKITISMNTSLAHMHTHTHTPQSFSSHSLNALCTRWLRDQFEDADRNGDGTLDLKEVVAMMRKLNVGVSKKVIRRKFQV